MGMWNWILPYVRIIKRVWKVHGLTKKDTKVCSWTEPWALLHFFSELAQPQWCRWKNHPASWLLGTECRETNLRHFSFHVRVGGIHREREAFIVPDPPPCWMWSCVTISPNNRGHAVSTARYHLSVITSQVSRHEIWGPLSGYVASRLPSLFSSNQWW